MITIIQQGQLIASLWSYPKLEFILGEGGLQLQGLDFGMLSLCLCALFGCLCHLLLDFLVIFQNTPVSGYMRDVLH